MLTVKKNYRAGASPATKAMLVKAVYFIVYVWPYRNGGAFKLNTNFKNKII